MSQVSYTIGLILAWLAGASGSLGNAVVLFSILLKVALLPLSLHSQRQMDRMKKMQPKLKALKEKHKGDPAAFQRAQVELMKEHQVNPVGGCIPQLVQFGILIVLYQVFISVFQTGAINGTTFETTYLWFDLRQSDPTYALPVLTGILQFFLSLMMLSPTETTAEALAAPVKPKRKGKQSLAQALQQQIEKKSDSKEDFSDISASMQKQMVFMLPVMTTVSFILLRLPAGLALYWSVTSLFSIVQQYYVSGPGALPEYWQKVKKFLRKES